MLSSIRELDTHFTNLQFPKRTYIKDQRQRLILLIASRHTNKTFSTIMNSLLTLSCACIYYKIAEFEVVPHSHKPFRQIHLPEIADILIWRQYPQPKPPFLSTSSEIPMKTYFLYYFCYDELSKGDHLVESLVNY